MIEKAHSSRKTCKPCAIDREVETKKFSYFVYALRHVPGRDPQKQTSLSWIDKGVN